jgi:hypothetical protein
VLIFLFLTAHRIIKRHYSNQRRGIGCIPETTIRDLGYMRDFNITPAR